ncbi:peptidase [Streptomyces sp. NPDC003077]|uniref:trypsin-like serine peptidase n=1 Tax=Streptomyces sp. NPDC003077 TaxID=3154443 RepID=UPI0033BDC76C
MALGFAVPTASAGAATPVETQAPPTSEPASAAAQERAAAYWTPERMRAATPLDLMRDAREALTKAASKAKGDGAQAVRSGAERVVKPSDARASSKGDVSVRAFPEGGDPWTGGGEVTKTAGRVFFTYQGREASCSGDAVTSANKSTVITAGHCVKLQGSWHTNWVFVPGYDNGQAPYGKWAATKTLSTPQWTASEDINYDVGAAVVGPLEGKRLTDVVGGQGLAFNSGYNKPMYAFGYPAADPYDGTKLIYCSGNTKKDFLLSRDHRLGCDMTGGSSGGPWFTQFDEATGKGLQASVNSFGYVFLPNNMFGPYFGDDAKKLYEDAQGS